MVSWVPYVTVTLDTAKPVISLAVNVTAEADEMPAIAMAAMDAVRTPAPTRAVRQEREISTKSPQVE